MQKYFIKNLKVISLPCSFNKFEYMTGLCDYLYVPVNLYVQFRWG